MYIERCKVVGNRGFLSLGETGCEESGGLGFNYFHGLGWEVDVFGDEAQEIGSHL